MSVLLKQDYKSLKKKLVGQALIIMMATSVMLISGHVFASKIEGKAPDFTLKSVRGDNLKLSEFRGEVVIINFWATWCAACREQMPILNDLYLRYRKQGLVVLGVNVEKKPGKAKNMISELRVVFPVLFDVTKSVSKLYDIEDMPSTILVDRDGNLRYLHNGYSVGYEEHYERQVRELMRE